LPTIEPSRPPAVQRREPATRDQCRRKADAAQRERAAIHRLVGLAALVDRPAGQTEQHGKQVRRRAEQHEKEIREPCAERTDQVLDRARLTGRGEGGVAAVVAQQRREQHQRERA
jgi:hypothetical protein